MSVVQNCRRRPTIESKSLSLSLCRLARDESHTQTHARAPSDEIIMQLKEVGDYWITIVVVKSAISSLFFYVRRRRSSPAAIYALVQKSAPLRQNQGQFLIVLRRTPSHFLSWARARSSCFFLVVYFNLRHRQKRNAARPSTGREFAQSGAAPTRKTHIWRRSLFGLRAAR